MARVMPKGNVIAQMVDSFPDYRHQRAQARRMDAWDTPVSKTPSLYHPENSINNDEYEDIANRSTTPWLSLIITSLAQTAFVEGISLPGQNEKLASWDSWQRNRMDARQGPLYRSALRHGISYASSLPGTDAFTKKPMSVIRAHSALDMAAFYGDDDDEWAMFAIRAEPHGHDGDGGRIDQVGDRRDRIINLDRLDNPYNDEYGWTARYIDDTAIHYLSCKGDGTDKSDWTYISYEEHGRPVTPIVAYHNMTDLSGRRVGEIEPLIPLAKRIDQDAFDRLIVQRFGAWKVRYASGMTKPNSAAEGEAIKLKLRIQDILVSENPDTKFGTLDATDLAGFIAARDADLRDLSAVSQTPPHHMLGLSSNLQAESLAAAEAGLARKSLERKTNWGESHEQLMRLDAYANGNMAEAGAYNMQVRWRDFESRSLSQAADALGKLAQQVQVPVEMLWERIPAWTDSDTERAKELLQDSAIDALMAELEAAGAAGGGAAAGGAPAKRTLQPA